MHDFRICSARCSKEVAEVKELGEDYKSYDSAIEEFMRETDIKCGPQKPHSCKDTIVSRCQGSECYFQCGEKDPIRCKGNLISNCSKGVCNHQCVKQKAWKKIHF